MHTLHLALTILSLQIQKGLLCNAIHFDRECTDAICVCVYWTHTRTVERTDIRTTNVRYPDRTGFL